MSNKQSVALSRAPWSCERQKSLFAVNSRITVLELQLSSLLSGRISGGKNFFDSWLWPDIKNRYPAHPKQECFENY